MSFDACKTIPTSSHKRYVKPKQWNKREVAQIYPQARSSDTEKFLEYVLKTAPYKVLLIQVDASSEFMKDNRPLKNITSTVCIPPCTD